jgi:hypothetical protein
VIGDCPDSMLGVAARQTRWCVGSTIADIAGSPGDIDARRHETNGLLRRSIQRRVSSDRPTISGPRPRGAVARSRAHENTTDAVSAPWASRS